MLDQVGTSQMIRFATFEVDLRAQKLRKGGLRLKLSGQPFQVLAILLEQPGVVVTREELQKWLWPDKDYLRLWAGCIVPSRAKT